ncbi:MAG: hypothetical protein AAGC60_13580 [Acidobacteriota bacterium]
MGDSWAEFMWSNRTLREVFVENGRPDLAERGAVTAIGGTTAAQWAGSQGLELISEELAAWPTIDTVQLTVGGNDLLAGASGGGWYVGIPQQELDAFTTRVVRDVTIVVDHALAQIRRSRWCSASTTM